MSEQLRAGLWAAVSGDPDAQSAADELCSACVGLLDVDGAALSLLLDGVSQGTVAATGQLSRSLNAQQFTVGQGPSMDAVADGRPVLAADLNDPSELRWPGFTGAALSAGVRAVFAWPVSLSGQRLAALTLYRVQAGALSTTFLHGGLTAARLAALPLLDLVTQGAADMADATARNRAGDDTDWAMSWLDGLEIHQAAGMVMVALDVDPDEALVRLRAQAFVRGTTAYELARQVLRQPLLLQSPDWQEPNGTAPPHLERP